MKAFRRVIRIAEDRAGAERLVKASGARLD